MNIFYIPIGVGKEVVSILVKNNINNVNINSILIERFNLLCPSDKFSFIFGTILNLLIAQIIKTDETNSSLHINTLPYVEVIIGKIPPKRK